MEDLILFSWAIVAGIIVCVLYGILGGDEKLSKKYKRITKALHWIHHWWIGLLCMVAASLLKNWILLGFGSGLFIDDRIYHSIELRARSD